MITLRELTIEERATWGTCPVCKAEHLERCDCDGAHIARLVNAPQFVTTDIEDDGSGG